MKNLNCPFCGGNPDVENSEDSVVVYCQTCNITVPTTSWNMRAKFVEYDNLEDALALQDKLQEVIQKEYNKRGLIPLSFDGILWPVHAMKVDLEGTQAVKLEWGWTAGMSDDILTNLAEDAPKENDSMYTTIDDAKGLRDKLIELLKE